MSTDHEEIGSSVSPASSDDIDLLELVLLLADSWRTLLVTPIVAGIIALAVSFLIPPTYTAVARILPPAQQNTASAALSAQLGALAALVNPSTGVKSLADQYVALLKSNSISDSIIAKFNLKEEYDEQFIEDAREELAKRVKFTAGSKDGIVTIEVNDHDPARSAAMANGFVSALRSVSSTLAITEAAQRRLFFDAQLKQAKVDLTNAELTLRESNVSESTLRMVPEAALEALARLKAQITAQEIKLASMRTVMTESNPELRLAIQELVALRSELSKAEQSNTVKAIGSGAEYIARYRDFKYHETLFDLMAKQYEIARLDEAREGSIIQVIDAATPPERETKPRKGLIVALVALLTFSLAIFLVLARHSFKHLAQDPRISGRLQRLRSIILPRS